MFLKTLRLPMIVIGLTAFIGSAQARDRGWEASPSVWSLYDQGRGNIPGACWEAYDRDRQWRWMLFCVNHFVMNSKFKDAELFYENAYRSALDWAEYGWNGGIKKGCDRDWGIMGLRHVANATLSGIDGGLIRQQANNELGRITSQNPPNVLHGPWVWPGVGTVSIRQYGAGFDGATKSTPITFSILYDRANPFRRWRDPATNQLTSWWVGNFTSARFINGGWQNGAGMLRLHELSPNDAADSTCRPTVFLSGTQVTLTRP